MGGKKSDEDMTGQRFQANDSCGKKERERECR